MATARLLSTDDQTQSKARRWQEVLDGDTSGFEICTVPNIGRGIKTTRAFKSGDILMRYFAELVSKEEFYRRENQGPEEGHFYRYVFKHKEQRHYLDATAEDGTYGRLINHSKKKANVLPKPVEIDGMPAVIFVAKVDLEVGVELRYDYGERRKSVIRRNSWLGR